MTALALQLYNWFRHIPEGVFCADCGGFVHGAWLRFTDGQPLCGACYAGREYRQEVSA